MFGVTITEKHDIKKHGKPKHVASLLYTSSFCPL